MLLLHSAICRRIDDELSAFARGATILASAFDEKPGREYVRGLQKAREAAQAGTVDPNEAVEQEARRRAAEAKRGLSILETLGRRLDPEE